MVIKTRSTQNVCIKSTVGQPIYSWQLITYDALSHCNFTVALVLQSFPVSVCIVQTCGGRIYSLQLSAIVLFKDLRCLQWQYSKSRYCKPQWFYRKHRSKKNIFKSCIYTVDSFFSNGVFDRTFKVKQYYINLFLLKYCV